VRAPTRRASKPDRIGSPSVDPLTYLFSLEKLGIKFGLENIRTLCAGLHDPQGAWRSVIVAGTNGKGSVSAMVEAGLRAGGYHTGLYTSPHLVRLEERFAIDGRPIDTARLVEAAAAAQDAVAGLRRAGALATEPTFFEVTTAIAFEVFRRERVNVAVLEVGLGGRFDATNVAGPLAAAITTIDFDHERFLGNTIAAIAGEKAGIVKPGMRVVVGETKAEAVDVIARVCREQGATMLAAGEGVKAGVVRLDEGRAVVELETPIRRYGELRLALRGRHQVQNAVVAVRLLETLGEVGLSLGPEAIGAAVAGVHWPGRLDLLADEHGRKVLCDSAHNPAGARVLAGYLSEVYPGRLPIVFAIMRDKDVTGTLAPLLPCASHLVVTRARTDRALDPSALADAARRAGWRGTLDVEPDAGRAIERAWQHAPEVCAAGSIFLVGEVLARWGRA
jgi:dihydrofolate synthase / folylpolyglutamate synthase